MNLTRYAVLFLLVLSSMIAIPFQYAEAGISGNSAPELLLIGDQKEDEGDTSQILFSAEDDNSGDILTFTSSPLPLFAVLMDNGDGTAKLMLETSLSDAGTYQITITVTDNGIPNLSDSETFDLVINDDGDPSSPELTIESTIEQVVGMIDDGVLNEGQAVSLIEKLDAAIKKLADGNDNAAYRMLQAFINQIEAFINSGVLTSAEGQPLIDAALEAQGLLF